MDATENRIGAIYVRANIVDKDASRNLDVQIRDVIAVANEHGIQIPEEHVFSEQANGTDSNRPVLNQIRQLAREGKIDSLVVHHPDRLSRNATEVAFIIGEITKAGVELIVVQKP